MRLHRPVVRDSHGRGAGMQAGIDSKPIGGMMSCIFVVRGGRNQRRTRSAS
jgi:hypothetical protein